MVGKDWMSERCEVAAASRTACPGIWSDVAMASVTRTDEECAICVATRASEDAAPGDKLRELVYLDDVLAVLVESDVEGVLLAPRKHVGELAANPEVAGAVLAGLRRAAVAVQDHYRASGATVQPKTDLPGALGHVCYWVMPTLPSPTAHDEAHMEQLISLLRCRFTGQTPSTIDAPGSSPIARRAHSVKASRTM